VLKRQHCVAIVVISDAVPVAGRFDSAAGGCARLFHAALQYEPEHRESFLAAACQDDEEL
jgi:hypothetical protein